MRLSVLIATLSVLLPASSAFAEDGGLRAVVDEEGWTVLVGVLEAPAEDVRSFLSDGVLASRLSPAVTAAELVTSEGACEEIRRASKAVFSEMDYVVERCSTAVGEWTERLLSSNLLKGYQMSTSTEPSGVGATRIVLKVRTELLLPVPRYLLRSELRRSLEATMRSLVAHFED